MPRENLPWLYLVVGCENRKILACNFRIVKWNLEPDASVTDGPSRSRSCPGLDSATLLSFSLLCSCASPVRRRMFGKYGHGLGV